MAESSTAKDIIIKPIKPATANYLTRLWHYSGKVVPNSQLHLGVFLNGRVGGGYAVWPKHK